ncbi:MAG: hypothetical protein HC906_16700 [Bacteroidales bacterium]|nr:hypothetical protein [Bacteroidales bacterium]
MKEIVSHEQVNDIVSNAIKVTLQHGLLTRNDQLLEKAKQNAELKVKGNRILPSGDLLYQCLDYLKNQSLPKPDKKGNHHGWPDMLTDFAHKSLLIRISDLPYQFFDAKKKQIIPLSREQVIEGTKFLHVLSCERGIKGYSCGVPQDTVAPLKAIEQYLIGYRYNINGGATIQSVDREVEREFHHIRCIAEERKDVNTRSLMLFSPSPMILDSDDLYLCFQQGVQVDAFMVGSMPMMGMTAPVDPVGAYILALAEVIGAAAILHAVFPEAAAYIYPHPQAMDLMTGQMAFGTREHARSK